MIRSTVSTTKVLWVLLLIILAAPLTAFPDTRQAVVGSAMLALQHKNYPCKKALRQFRRSRVKYTSLLSNTFGNSTRCLRRFIALRSDRTYVQIYVENGAGRRNRRLKKGELFPRLTSPQYNAAWQRGDPAVILAFRKRVQRWARFARKHASERVRFIITPILEGDTSVRVAAKMTAVTREEWPYAVGWNPHIYRGGAHRVGADLVELHGDVTRFPRAVPCIANLDGLQPALGRRNKLPIGRVLSDAKLSAWLGRVVHRCDYVQLWDQPISNGERPGSPWKPPRGRSFPMERPVIAFINRYLTELNGRY